MVKKITGPVLMVGVYFAFVFAGYVLYTSGMLNGLIFWAKQNLVVYFIFIVAVKTMGLIFPPIPGGLVTWGSIIVIGWQAAFAADFVGGIFGATANYYMGKKWGMAIVEKIFGERISTKIAKMKIRKGREVESVAIFKIAGGGTIVEAISFFAGIIGLNLKQFLIGSAIASFVIGVPTYVLTDNLLSSRNIILNLVAIVIGFFVLYKVKGRYFE